MGKKNIKTAYVPLSARTETKFGEFCKRLAEEGITYAEWQKSVYGTKLDMEVIRRRVKSDN